MSAFWQFVDLFQILHEPWPLSSCLIYVKWELMARFIKGLNTDCMIRKEQGLKVNSVGKSAVKLHCGWERWGFYSYALVTVNVHPLLLLLHCFNLLLWYKHLIAEEFALWRERGLLSSCFYLFLRSKKVKVSLPVLFFTQVWANNIFIGSFGYWLCFWTSCSGVVNAQIALFLQWHTLMKLSLKLLALGSS